jgi:hypothetical protein
MAVTGSKFGPGITDPDYGLIGKFIIGNPLVLHPGTIDKSVLATSPEPITTSELIFIIFFHSQIFFSC